MEINFFFFLAALLSVFKTSELESFTGLSRKDKEAQLMEFTRIVTGIRLFNKDCQKGGEGIDDRKFGFQRKIKASTSS